MVGRNALRRMGQGLKTMQFIHPADLLETNLLYFLIYAAKRLTWAM